MGVALERWRIKWSGETGGRTSSDTRLKKFQAIDNSIGAFFWGNLEPEMALHLLHTMFGLFDDKGIWDAGIARVYPIWWPCGLFFCPGPDRLLFS
jgi:hypothetical protein